MVEILAEIICKDAAPVCILIYLKRAGSTSELGRYTWASAFWHLASEFPGGVI